MALILIAWRKLTFDEKVELHRVDTLQCKEHVHTLHEEPGLTEAAMGMEKCITQLDGQTLVVKL